MAVNVNQDFQLTIIGWNKVKVIWSGNSILTSDQRNVYDITHSNPKTGEAYQIQMTNGNTVKYVNVIGEYSQGNTGLVN